MKYFFFILFVFVLVGCGEKSKGFEYPNRHEFDQEILIMTPEVKFLPVDEAGSGNRPVFLNKENFEAEMSQIIQLAGKISPTTSLKYCEIGVADPEGFQVLIYGNQETCAILLVTAKDTVSPGYLGEIFGGQQMVVAMTTDIVGTDYPLILVPEAAFDLNYYVRVMAHQGLLADRIRGGLNTGSDAEETALGYELQFSILEEQYSSMELAGAPESILVPGLPEASFEALRFEHLLYQRYKEGTLVEFLELLGEPGDPQGNDA